MRNKSRKRILHEQRVEIAKLRRDKAFLQDKVRRMSAERIPPEIITYSVFVNDSDNGKLQELLFANVGERIIRDIVRAIIRSNTMQIVTTPMTESGGTKISRYRKTREKNISEQLALNAVECLILDSEPLSSTLLDIASNKITYGKAIYIVEHLYEYDDEQIGYAIFRILSMPTINAVPKDDLLKIIRYLFDECYSLEEVVTDE